MKEHDITYFMKKRSEFIRKKSNAQLQMPRMVLISVVGVVSTIRYMMLKKPLLTSSMYFIIRFKIENDTS